MFPRRSAISRSALVIGIVVVFLWMLSNVGYHNPSDIAHIPDNFFSLRTMGVLYRNNTSLVTRRFTVADASVEHKEKKLHQNQTLQKMIKNMTLLKVNKTDLRDAMSKINDSSSNLANPHPFKYIINTETVCRDKDIFVIAYIHTAPSHYKRRMVIRQTWGNPKHYPDWTLRVIFVMGKTDDKKEVQQALLFESEQYGDIVQEDFHDSYRNLTYKGVAALKWITNYCRHAKFVLKTDDDIFVNTFTLFRHLRSLHSLNVHTKSLIMCLVWYRMPVMRDGKWKVTKEQYKEKFYPTYCSGSAFTMSTDVAVRMYNISLYTAFFWVDDFYITGLLPLKLGIKHRQFMSTYVLNGNQLEQKFTGPQWFTYIFSHVHDLNRVQAVWDQLVLLATGKTVVQVKYALPGQLPKENKKPNPG